MQGEITAWFVLLLVFLVQGEQACARAPRVASLPCQDALTFPQDWHHMTRSWRSLSVPFRSCLEVLIQAWYKPLRRSTAASWGSAGIKGRCCTTPQPC